MTAAEMIDQYKIEDGAKMGRPGAIWIDKAIIGKMTKAETDAVKAAKAEILDELERREMERKERIARREAEQKAAYEAEKQAIVSGEKTIEVRFVHDDFAGHFEVSGPAVELLAELGLVKARHVGGYEVDVEVVEALGRSFTYEAAEIYARPVIEVEEAKQTEEKAERDAKFDEAKATGQRVELDRASVVCDGSVSECSVDIIVRYAMPDGHIEVERTHTF